jgi:hypothetical protein
MLCITLFFIVVMWPGTNMTQSIWLVPSLKRQVFHLESHPSSCPLKEILTTDSVALVWIHKNVVSGPTSFGPFLFVSRGFLKDFVWVATWQSCKQDTQLETCFDNRHSSYIIWIQTSNQGTIPNQRPHSLIVFVIVVALIISQVRCISLQSLSNQLKRNYFGIALRIWIEQCRFSIPQIKQSFPCPLLHLILQNHLKGSWDQTCQPTIFVSERNSKEWH